VGTKLQQRHAAAAYTAFNVLPHTTVTAGPSSTPWDPLSGGRVVRSAADAAEQLAMLNVSPHSQPFPSPYDDSSLPFDEAADDTVDPLYLGASERRDPAVARCALTRPPPRQSVFRVLSYCFWSMYLCTPSFFLKGEAVAQLVLFCGKLVA
jgi:hypothetical protein